ncbi:hypothetical protein ACFVMC_25525 [Nocardia sp. NPDC127579]|uniref:hypothetical protein n=1 Tax=Nocardia sp. NPDC127579 TaxID=3345402 RepID=UPI0036282F93
MAEDSEFDRLTKAAEGKFIRLKPDAAKECARLCGAMLTELDSAITEATKLADVKGFGTIADADALTKRYNDRATTGDSSLKYSLTKHREVVNDMMETFIVAGRAYLLHEQASADALATYNTAVDSYRPKPK